MVQGYAWASCDKLLTSPGPGGVPGNITIRICYNILAFNAADGLRLLPARRPLIFDESSPPSSLD
jgi:hypothetical protein